MPATDPSRSLLELIIGYWNTQALHVLARLGIPDLLAGKRMDTAALAAATGSDVESLRRLLRFLTGLGVLVGDDETGFALTELGELLRTDVEGSMHDLAVLYGEEFYAAWGSLLHNVRTGEQAFKHTFGTSMFDYFGTHPATGRTFDRAMAAGRAFFAEIPEVYDFSHARTVVDIAGGNGSLLAAVLRKNPDLTGVLFDVPPVVEAARTFLKSIGLVERCRFETGDFFRAVPQGGDVYLLCRILHDWDDERCVALLTNCHAAMTPGGTLLIVERLLPEYGRPSLALGYGVHMMAVAGGRERTEEEYRVLLGQAGFDVGSTHELPLDIHALVASRR